MAMLRESDKIRFRVFDQIWGRMSEWDDLPAGEKIEREKAWEDQLNKAGAIDQANGQWN